MRRFFYLPIVGILLVVFTAAAIAPQINRLTLEKEIESLYKQIKDKEQTFVEPSAQDKAQFAQFLAQPDTGIFRILPRNKYDGKLLTVPGNGSYYSFSRRSNTYGYGSDIEYSQGKFRTGFSSSAVGFFSQLGDISIESITLEHPAARFLNNYVAPTKESEIRQHQQQQSNFTKGIREGEFTFSSQVALFANTTYVLRSIDYYASSDILVALRVVKQEGDGSLVILWKKLKLFPTPIAER